MDEYMVEIEETYVLGKMTKRTANGVEIPVDTIEGTGIVTQRLLMTHEEVEKIWGKIPNQKNPPELTSEPPRST